MSVSQSHGEKKTGGRSQPNGQEKTEETERVFRGWSCRLEPDPALRWGLYPSVSEHTPHLYIIPDEQREDQQNRGQNRITSRKKTKQQCEMKDYKGHLQQQQQHHLQVWTTCDQYEILVRKNKCQAHTSQSSCLKWNSIHINSRNMLSHVVYLFTVHLKCQSPHQ